MRVAQPPLATPLLVPSFSSCGFPQDKKQLRQVTRANFQLYAGEFESLLVSAYDLYHGYVAFEDLPRDSIVVVDSGGYEISQEEDDSAIYPKPQPDGAWNEELLLATWAKMPDDPRFIFVNLDSRDNISAQVHRAIAQMGRFSHARRSFLFKEDLSGKNGGEGNGYVSLTPTIAQFATITAELACFDVIGVTEKSLGQSYFERLKNLRLLTALLQKHGLNIPVHVFGALDPLSVRIYAMAGAEIFDGLTWVRFAYRGDECVYLNNELLRDSDLQLNLADEGHDSIFNRNYAFLQGLQAQLREYRTSGDEKHLGLDAALLNKVTRAIKTAEQAEDFRRLIG